MVRSADRLINATRLVLIAWSVPVLPVPRDAPRHGPAPAQGSPPAAPRGPCAARARSGGPPRAAPPPSASGRPRRGRTSCLGEGVEDPEVRRCVGSACLLYTSDAA